MLNRNRYDLSFLGALNERLEDADKGIAYETINLNGDFMSLPATSDNGLLSAAMEAAITLSGRKPNGLPTPLPAVRLVGNFTLSHYFGGIPVAGLFLPSREELWLNRGVMDGSMSPKDATDKEQAYRLRQSVIVHELVHWLQYLDDPTGFKSAVDGKAYIDNEIEAFQVQWRYLEPFGLTLKSFIGADTFDAIPEKVHDAYDGIQQSVNGRPIIWLERLNQHKNMDVFERKYTMESQGWQRLGSGSRASVLAHDKLPGKVVKIGRYDRQSPVRRGWYHKPAGDAYLHYLKQFGDTGYRHVPAVDSVILYPEFYVATMERLNPFPNYNAFKHALAKVEGFINTLSLETCREIWPDHFAATTVRMDLEHDSNMMQRHDGTPVVTDPYY